MPPSLIKKRKSHIHSLSVGANIVLGNNGYIWISPGSLEKSSGFEQDFEVKCTFIAEFVYDHPKGELVWDVICT